LAGFTDGSYSSVFNILINKRKNTIRFSTQCKLAIKISQPIDVNGKFTELASFSIFNVLAEYLKTCLISKTIRSNNYIKFIFTIVMHTPYSQDIVMEYFDKFPLLGKKALDYLN
jgi:hypothetical protein